MSYTEQVMTDVLNYCWHHGVTVPDTSQESIDSLVKRLIHEDEVTGYVNGYTYDTLAMRYVTSSIEILQELVKTQKYTAEELTDHIMDFVYWDVQIRMYLLPEVVRDAIEELVA